MDLNFSDAEREFREEVRSFFRTQVPEDLRRKVILGQRLSADDVRRWTAVLLEKGWATTGWPVEWGGTGWDPVRQHIFREEMHMAPAPEPLIFNTSMIGPLLCAFGSEEQKRHFLPRIASLEYWFCQGFSEPGAGSDLASLQTFARREGDEYVVNGQKIWTTKGHHANWCFLLVRTDREVKKQKGITMLMAPMDTPGLTVKPIVSIDRYHELNEMFFDEMRIPVANRIGEENKGWDYAKYLLSHERFAQARIGLSKLRLAQAKALATRMPHGAGMLADDPFFRDRLASLEVELKAFEILTLRVVSDAQRSASSGPEPKSSILKLKGVALQLATIDLLMEVAGYDAMEQDSAFLAGAAETAAEDWAASIAPNAYFARHVSIAAGSSEIQRNIFAHTVLGL